MQVGFQSHRYDVEVCRSALRCQQRTFTDQRPEEESHSVRPARTSILLVWILRIDIPSLQMRQNLHLIRGDVGPATSTVSGN